MTEDNEQLSTQEQAPTEPGIYRGLSFETYQAIEAVSRSQLLRLFHSPAAFHWGADEPETLAMKGGTFTHAAVLEPERFGRECVVMPNFHGGMKDDTARDKGYDGGREAKAAWLEEHEGAVVVEGQVREEALGISAAVHRVPGAHTLLGGPAETHEVTIIHVDPVTGLRCKIRCDAFFENNRGGYTIPDLKKVRSVRHDDFNRKVGDERLHIQAAFYLFVAQGVLGAAPDPVFGDGWAFPFVCFEGRAPHWCRVYELPGCDIDVGQREVRRMLDTVAWCKAMDHWPDYSDQTWQGKLSTYYTEFQLPDGYEEVQRNEFE